MKPSAFYGVRLYVVEPACEPSTLADLLANFVSRSRYIDLMIRCSVPHMPAIEQIKWNLLYASVLARLNYYRVPEALPTVTTFDSLWFYYKRYWNTYAGKATPDSFRNALRLTDIKV